MHIFYIDESYDNNVFVLSALGIRDDQWHKALDLTKAYRRGLAASDGVYVRRELHASRFVRDCNDGISRRALTLADRRRIFESVLVHTSSLPIGIMNICQPVAKWGSVERAHLICIERMANRIERTMKAKGSYAVTVIDEGKEKEITTLLRKIRIHNPIPSMYGSWPEGSSSRNITLERLIDDPFFRDSRGSYFLQLVDFVAYSLLKREVPPTKFVSKWGYDGLFPLLGRALFKPPKGTDPLGIFR